MDNQQTISKAEDKGLIKAPKLELEDMATLSSAVGGLRELRKQLKEQYHESVKATILSLVKKEKRGIIGFRKEYEILNFNSFDKAGEKSISIAEEIIPKEIKQVGSDVRIVREKLEKVYAENNIFLKYFFLTPINKAKWEKSWREVVPVVLKSSVLFGACQNERVVEFEQRGHENGNSLAEDMQMVPFPLKPEQIDFYKSRILRAAQCYGDEMRRLAGKLAKFKGKDVELPPHLAMDIDIMNYCLENLAEGGYKPQIGAFAIQLGTSTIRVGAELESITRSLNNAVSDINHIGGDGKADPAAVDTNRNWYVWFSSGNYLRSSPFLLNVP